CQFEVERVNRILSPASRWRSQLTGRHSFERPTKGFRTRDQFRCAAGGPNRDNRPNFLGDRIFPFATFLRLRFTLENGITLSRECHKRYAKDPTILKPSSLQAAA